MPGLRRTTTCRGCGKPIAFIKTANGKSIPVDPDPVWFEPMDEKEKFVTAEGEVQQGRTIETASTAGKMAIGYRTHFATCPAAEDFRRKKNKSERVKSEQ